MSAIKYLKCLRLKRQSCVGLAAIASAIAMPAAGQDIPQRPVIGLNRWQEDWSVLADPSLKTSALDGLKYIPLTDDDPTTYLSLGGGLRERVESNDAPLLHTVPGQADTYLLSRLELHADLRDGPIQVFVQLQSDFAPGKTNLTMVDSNRLDLEQGFVALVEKVGDGTLKLRIGRQQFAFDLQRFVAVRDGPNVRQSFDAIWGDYEIGPWRLIAYYTQPVIDRDNHPFDDFSSRALRFYGVRVERHVLGRNELSTYWSRYDNAAASYLFASGMERRDVWDLRFAGHLSVNTDQIDWDTEAMAQTGWIAARPIRAWATGARAGYSFKSVQTQPRLGLQVDAASGNRHGADGPLGTFNPLFSNGDYVTLSGYTGYANFVHVKPSLTVHPDARLSLMAAAAALWRMTRADAVYTQPNVPVPRTAGEGALWTGHYGQLRADWRANGNFSAALEFVHFDVGSALRNVGASASNYLGVEGKFQW